MERTREDPGISLHLIKTLGQRIDRSLNLLRNRITERQAEEGDGTPALAGDAPWPNSPLVGEANSPVALETLQEETLALDAKGFVAFADLLQVGQHCRWYGPHQVIFQEGDASSCMYMILQGAVEIRHNLEGTDILAARRGVGDFFGEVALLTGLPRSTTAITRELTCLVPIGMEQLLEEIRNNAELALYVVRLLILRLRQILAALASSEQSVALGRQCLPPLLKPKERISFAVVSLSSCGGCAAALLDDHQELGKLLQKANITYCPMLMDNSELGEVDVVLVDDIARVKEDEEKLIEARQKCRFLVAWGTCAAFGGIPAMANRFELEDLLQESYGEALDPFAYYLSGAKGLQRFMYQARKFGLLRLAYPADHFVRVDYYLPGCPPSMGILLQWIADLTGDNPGQEVRGVICGECGRKPKRQSQAELEGPAGGVDLERCFLSLGMVCLGTLTKGGCGAVCPRGGLPCWGCRGLASGILRKIWEGETYNEILLKILKQRSHLDEERLKPVIRQFSTQTNNALNVYHILKSDLARLK